jgi:hypothetical protein
MKQFLLALALAAVIPAWADAEPRETKKVCVDQKDKEGKPVTDAKGVVKQTCKTVKKHTKLDVPADTTKK